MMKAPIPVRISPLFWLSAALIGWLSSFTLIGTLLWVLIIFISILIHEYGHALTARHFGQFPRIELVAFGGLTYPEGPPLSSVKEFIVVLNGPLASLSLYGLGTLLLYVPAVQASGAAPIVEAFRLINLFWTVINLFPVLPLDGGQLVRVALEGFFGVKGLKFSMILSMILAVAVAAIAFFLGWFLVGAIFFLFAFQNIQTWKMARPIRQIDKDQSLHEELIRAEEEILRGHLTEAEAKLDVVREKTKEGILFISATQHLARLCALRGDSKKTYELLLSIKDNLSEDFEMLMHKVAFECGDYPLVLFLSSSCFQKDPSALVALRCAKAAAALDHLDETIGWLEAYVRAGGLDKAEVAKDKIFDKVRSSEDFKEWLKS